MKNDSTYWFSDGCRPATYINFDCCCCLLSLSQVSVSHTPLVNAYRKTLVLSDPYPSWQFHVTVDLTVDLTVGPPWLQELRVQF